MLLSRSPSGPKKYFPIPVEHLEEEIRLRSADDFKRFREEFTVSAQDPAVPPGGGESKVHRQPGDLAGSVGTQSRSGDLGTLVPGAAPLPGTGCPS